MRKGAGKRRRVGRRWCPSGGRERGRKNVVMDATEERRKGGTEAGRENTGRHKG